VHICALTGGTWAASLATQYVAARLAYHPHLGPWLYHASAAARERFSLVMHALLVAAAVALLTARWRRAVLPFAIGALTAVVARDAPLYSPDRLFVWYAAYHGVAAYRRVFLVAWGVFAIATVAATVAGSRLTAPRLDPTPTGQRQPERHFGDDIIN
jgi:hypothetical protein